MGKEQFEEWCKHLKINIKCQEGKIPFCDDEVIYKMIYISDVYIGKLTVPEHLMQNYVYQFQEINKLIINHSKKQGQLKTVRGIMQKLNIKV